MSSKCSDQDGNPCFYLIHKELCALPSHFLCELIHDSHLYKNSSTILNERKGLKFQSAIDTGTVVLKS